jgi:hypothetical protein
MSVHMNITAADPALSDWIEHDGGDCPLPYETLVNLKFRSGLIENKPCFAGFWRTGGPRNWWRRRTGPMLTWTDQSRNDCITHYRLVPVTLTDVVRLSPTSIAA